MTKLEKLKALLAKLIAEARALNDKEGDLSEEDIGVYDTKMAEARLTKGAIAREEALEAEERALKDKPLESKTTGVVVGADLEAEKPFSHFGEQLRAIHEATTRRDIPVDKRLLHLNAQNRAVLGMNEGIPSEGGFAVQTDFAGSIFDTAVKTGDILSRVDTYTVGAGSNGAEWLDIDETDVSSTVFGGVQVYWAGEAEGVTATKPKLRMRKMDLEKLFGVAYVTYEMMQDTTFMGALLSKAFSTAIQRKLEGDILVDGTGVGRPLSIINSDAKVSVAKQTGQAADTVVYENVSKMWHRIHSAQRSNATWLVNPDVDEQLDFMVFPVGTGGVPVYLPAGGASATGYSSLKGRPVIPTDHCSAIGDVGDIMLSDLSQYMLLTKGGADEQVSMHVQFLTAQECFRVIYRAMGGPKKTSTLTLKNSSNARADFVTLAAR